MKVQWFNSVPPSVANDPASDANDPLPVATFTCDSGCVRGVKEATVPLGGLNKPPLVGLTFLTPVKEIPESLVVG